MDRNRRARLQKSHQKAYKQRKNSIIDKIDYLEKESNLQVDDIKQLIDNGQIRKAERYLITLERKYNEFQEITSKIKFIKTKSLKLSNRLVDGELDSESYKRAANDLDKQKKSIEEQIWKIRNKLFKENYEKPF